MTKTRRPRRRLAIPILIAASFLMAACGVSGSNSNWPGLSTDGENVYVAYGPRVLAVAVNDGEFEQVWMYPAEGSAALSFFAAPSVQGDRVIIGDFGASGGFFNPAKTVTIYSLPNQPGIPVPNWPNSQIAEDSIVAPPLQVGDRVFVGTAANQVFALDAETGNPLWAEPFETGHSIWGQPAYNGETLFVTSLDNMLYALSAESGELAWESEGIEGAIAGAPVVNENLVYVASFDHNLYALDASSGDVVWQEAAEDWIWSAPTYENGVVYYADVQGNVFARDGRDGTLLWQKSLDKPIQTSPLVVDGVVIIGSEGSGDTEQGLLTALSADDGDQLWQEETPAPLYTTPVQVGGTIVVAIQSESALLVAFDLESGSQTDTFKAPEE